MYYKTNIDKEYDWFENYTKAKEMLNTIENSSCDLDKLYTEYLKPSLKNNKDDIKKNIDNSLQMIKKRYNVIKQIIKTIENLNNKNNSSSEFQIIEESVLCLKEDFRKSFKEIITKNNSFIEKCKYRENIIKDFNLDFGIDNNNDDIDDSPFLKEYSELDREIETRENFINKRTKQLCELSQEIIELNELVNEFNGFVVDQGEKLDRIEFKIDVADDSIINANNNLEDAHRYQTRSNNCCYLFIILIIIFIIILITVFFLYLKFFLGLI